MSVWTTQKPTKPGWYWWRDVEGDEVVVELMESGAFFWGADKFDPNASGEWSSEPIEEPKE